MHGSYWNGSKWVYSSKTGVTQRGIYRKRPPLPMWNRVRAKHNWKVALAVALAQAKRKIAFRNHVKRNFSGSYAKRRQRRRDFRYR